MIVFETEREAWVYLAAWIDTEGTIGVGRTKPKPLVHYPVAVRITNTDPAPLLVVQSFSGGALTGRHEGAGHRPSYRLWLGARRCRIILPLVRPFLIVKARQADLAMEALEILSRRLHGASRTMPHTTERLNAIYDEMQALNARGLVHGRDTLHPRSVRPARRARPYTEDEVLPNGFVILWSQPRPDAVHVDVRYSCCDTIYSRDLHSLPSYRTGRVNHCDACRPNQYGYAKGRMCQMEYVS